MRQTIRLTESELNNMIAESVNEVMMNEITTTSLELCLV